MKPVILFGEYEKEGGLRWRSALRASPLRRLRTESKVLAQFFASGALRFLALGLSALSQIWIARCLGPSKLGVSGMVSSVVAQILVLSTFNLDGILVRRFKHCDAAREKEVLIGGSLVLRGALTLLIGLGGAVFCLFAKLPPVWSLPLSGGFALLFLQSGQCAWLLQGQENVPAQYRAMVLQAAIVSVLGFLFIRPATVPAGVDLWIGAAGLLAATVFSWHVALRRGETLRPRLPVGAFRFSLSLMREGKWLFLCGVVIQVYTMFEQPMLGSLSSLAELGRYRSACQLGQIVQAFTLLLPALLYPKLLTALRDGQKALWEAQKYYALRVGLCVAAIIPVCWLAAPFVHHLLFGAAFDSAAIPSALLVTSKLLVAVVGIFGWGLIAGKKDRLQFFIMSGVALLSVTANCLLIPRHGMRGVAWVNLLSEILVGAALFFACRKQYTDSLKPSAA